MFEAHIFKCAEARNFQSIVAILDRWRIRNTVVFHGMAVGTGSDVNAILPLIQNRKGVRLDPDVDCRGATQTRQQHRQRIAMSILTIAMQLCEVC